MTTSRYRNPQALRQAISDRLSRLARDHPDTQVADLQRQLAYDRLLTRVFSKAADRWVLKGGTAMLARLGGRARHTLDIDLYSQQEGLAEAEQALRAAAALDLGDYFRFILHPGQAITEVQHARRFHVDAYLGVTTFTNFRVDLSAGLEMTGVPDEAPPLVPIDLGLVSTTYRIYPIVDHVADKVCPLLEMHPRQAGPSLHSTRYRDLADLAVFAHTALVEAANLRTALTVEALRRGLALPTTLPTLDWPGWRAGYAHVARDVPGLTERELETALATVRRFIDPVLTGNAAGRWIPERLSWVPYPSYWGAADPGRGLTGTGGATALRGLPRSGSAAPRWP